MKVTKTYRRYDPEKSFGVITSPQPKAVYLKHNGGAQYCACGAAEKVLIWNLNTAETTFILERDVGLEAVSCLITSESEKSGNFRVGVGYVDGWVHIFHVHFDTMEAELEAHFRAGKSRVSCLDMKTETFVCAADAAINVFDMVSGCGSKLKGHRGLISCVALVNNGLVLISSAQDTFIKFWNVKSLHCFATLTGHPGPVWDFSLAAENRLLISGSGDTHLRLWNLQHFDPDELCPELVLSEKNSTEVSSGSLIAPLSERQSCIQAEFVGSIPRFGSRRVHSLIFDQTGMFLFCQSFDRTLEVFRLLDEDAKTKRLRKKIKKMKEKGEPIAEVKLEASDIIRPIIRLILPAKPASCDVLAARPIWKNGIIDCFHVRFIVALTNNCLEEVDVIVPCTCTTLKPQLLRLSVNKTVGSKGIGIRVLNRIHAPGHRSAPIACCLTSDSRGIFTLSRTEAKLWSRYSTACLATLTWSTADTQPTDDEADNPGTEPEPSHAVQTLPSKASAFVLAPGDRHVVVGFESGHLLLFDVHSKSIRQIISDGHQGAVRALALTGDQKSIISGGSDKRVTFYNFDLKITASKPPTLCLVEARAPETVADQITCLGVSPNNRLVVIGLVNFHVDVYFLDSFKRIHSLYGHAAPVTSLDISADSRLIITGSGDKTVRLWELQFGNCQRRFTSHMEPVTCVRFIPHTVLAVTADQGGQIRQWDVSKLREVTSLKGHHDGVTGLATAATNAAILSRKARTIQKKKFSKKHKEAGLSGIEDEDPMDDSENDWDDLCGGLVVSCGRDFSIRIWSESEELLILEEEAELAREAAEDEELIRSEAVVTGAVPAEVSETGLIGRPTPNTRDAADMLMEAIDIYEQECAKKEMRACGKSVAPPHPLLVAQGTSCPERFLLNSLAALRAPGSRLGGGGAGLEHALGAITTEHARRLLPCLASWLTRGWEVELVGRAIRHLVTLHFGLVVTSLPLRDVLHQSRDARLHQLNQIKSLIGTNLAGLDYLRRKIEDTQQAPLFEELLLERNKRVRRQKAKRNRMALLLPG